MKFGQDDVVRELALALCCLAAVSGGSALAVPPAAERTAAMAAHPGLADRDGDHLSDGLQARLATLQPDAAVDVVVSFSVPVSPAAAQQAVGAFRLKREFQVIHGFAATMRAAQAQALATHPGVFRVEADVAVHAVLDAADRDFGTQAARGLTTAGLRGTGVGICVIDTGADPKHEQLDSKIQGFMDLVKNSPTAYDDHGHGTHVSAIAAGDGVGVVDPTLAALFHGVAPGAGLYAAKVLDANGSGALSVIIGGIDWCVQQQDVHILSMSLGTAEASDGQDALSLAVNNAVTTYGRAVVVAAGNSGSDPQSIGSPGAAAQAITVGAAAEWSAPPGTDRRSQGVYLAPFSSRGPTLANLRKPDITAPGVTITSAQAGTGSGYVTYSGTSMATPFVAGTLALALEAKSTLTPTELKQLLFDTAQDRGASTSTVDKSDNDWGAGVLDGYAFVGGALGLTVPPHAFPRNTTLAGSVGTNGIWEYSFEVTETSQPIAATVLLSGQPICVLGFGNICFAEEWSPDLDARLLDPAGNEIASSGCAGFGDCAGLGRQETLYAMPAVTGSYRLQVFPYAGSPNDGKGGNFVVDLSASTSEALPPPPVLPTLHLGALSGLGSPSGGKWRATATITVHNASHGGLAGATVNGAWSNGAKGTGSCTTDSNGTCSISKSGLSRSRTAVTFTVTGLSKADHDYDATANEPVSTAITIRAP